MKLDHLYALRKDFSVIGLTGRTGSGCTMIAELLSNSFDNLTKKGLRKTTVFTDEIFKRKYTICMKFLEYENNWVAYEVIKYKNVLLFYILNKYGGNTNYIKQLLQKYYRESKEDDNREQVRKVLEEIKVIDEAHKETIQKIKSIKGFKGSLNSKKLKLLNEIFFGVDYKMLSKKLFDTLEKHGYYRRTLLLHTVACNIRSSGDPLNDSNRDIKYIYSIAELTNKIIKARKFHNGKRPTKIIIDSLRNSLEIMFFKERYSAFYMVATKDVLNNAKERVDFRLKKKVVNITEREKLILDLFELDEIEYKTNDFSKGNFASPDVENCIQKSDYHIFNLRKKQIKDFTENVNVFLTREEQLMKLICLITQPGLITPSSAERCMQIANTAKLNSGCISRKVGAVITDKNHYIKAIGWNDVAKGHTPCNLRSVTDFLNNSNALNKNPHYSEFEKGNISSLSAYKYKGEDPGNFKEALVDYFDNSFKNKSQDLNGKNCSFCFKTVHNHYEGEANQVHTRSLHAEENAMLQITKIGGQGVENGYLFTTASPCELCSKKAYQLGIKVIFYIDPYPGISVDQILNGGNNKPLLKPFSGAIGTAYHKLYEPFMSYKDEISMTLELNPGNKMGIEFRNMLKKVNDPRVKKYLSKKKKMNDGDVLDILSKAFR